MSAQPLKVGGLVFPGDGWNESADMIRRHVIADVLSARSAHRTMMALRAAGHPEHFADSAKSIRDSALRGARHHLKRYRASIARNGLGT